MPTINMNIRTNSTVKAQAQELFDALGMDISTAVNIFLRQAIRQQGLPFKVGLDTPNRDTMEAIAEIEDMKKHPEKYKSYSDVDAMMEELLS